jgi:hypothetical protein
VAIAGAWQLWRERNWRAPALTVATALLTVAPYVAYISARYGAFVPIGRGGYVLLWANNEYADGGYDPHFLERTLTIGGETKPTREWLNATDPIERDRQAMRLALQWIRENPAQWLWLLGRKLALTLSAFGLQNPENRGVAAALRLADGVYWLFLALGGYGLWRLRTSDRAFTLARRAVSGLDAADDSALRGGEPPAAARAAAPDARRISRFSVAI